ncbi:MAG: outer membrane beta-barrel protein [Alphaproteobacteria bacterium]
MKNSIVGFFCLVTIVMLLLAPANAQQTQQQPAPEQKLPEPAEKPLAPGWLSLDSSVGVADRWIALQKSSIESALGIGISGYLDSSYQWGSNHPHNPAQMSGRYFDQDYNKIDWNDFHIELDKPEKDWGVGFHLSGDFGLTGKLLRQATLWGPTLVKEPSAELRESYITTTIPIGAGLQFKGGLFVTLLGTETLLAPGSYNDEISRSFAFNYAVPLRHLGGLFTYPVLKTLSVSGGLVTGWDDPYDNNGSPSFLGGVNFAPSDTFTLVSSIVVGPEQSHNTNNQRFTWSNVATIKPMDPLTVYLEYTFGTEHQAPTPTGNKNAQWYAFSAIGSWSWTERFSTALRTELFLDEGASRTGGFAATKPVRNVSLGEVTLAGTYKFTKMLLGRAEFRQDWANRGVFQKGSSGADANQTTLEMQLLYQF